METNGSYTFRVEAGDWPEDCSVPMDAPFKDSRGEIQNLILRPCTSVAIINSAPRTIRANHYHRTDWHYAYVVSGEVLYFERPVGSEGIPEPKRFGPGTMFFTPPMVEHCMAFPVDTVFVTMAKNVRSHESHEADVVRVEFVKPSDLGW